MKRVTLKLSALIFAALLMLSLTLSVSAESVETIVTGIQKYGNLELGMKGSAFLDAGFTYGDIVTVTLNGELYDMPVGSNYSDVDNGSMLCRVVIKAETGEDAMLLAINMGDLATTAGIAAKTSIEADPGFEWHYTEGVEAIFYLMSRGISEMEAKAMIIKGFVEPISKELPLEYAVELNNLIRIELEGTVG